jgi:hypothetical protein
MNDEGRPKTALATHSDATSKVGGDVHPAVLDAREGIELEERTMLDGNRRARIALLISPTVEIFEALLVGESVPFSRIDPAWAARLGLRPGADAHGGVSTSSFNRVAADAPGELRVIFEDHAGLAEAGGAA